MDSKLFNEGFIASRLKRMGAPLAELEGRRKPSFNVQCSGCRGKAKTPNDRRVLCEKENLKEGVSCKRWVHRTEWKDFDKYLSHK